MKLSESQFIRERYLHLILESAMHEGVWKMTRLDHCHDAIASKLSLGREEYPIVSFYEGKRIRLCSTPHVESR